MFCKFYVPESSISPKFKSFCAVNNIDIDKAVQILVNFHSSNFTIGDSELRFFKLLFNCIHEGDFIDV